MNTPGQHICLAFEHNNIADRNRLSGVLRFVSTIDNWEIRILDTSLSDFPHFCRNFLNGWRIDALICSNLYTAESIRAATDPKKHFCLALLDALAPPNCSDITIDLDMYAVSREVIDLFCNRGYSQIGFVGTEIIAEQKWSLEFEASFVQFARERGITPFTFHTKSPFSSQEELTSLADWIKSLPKPCGLMAYSDSIGRTLIDACHLIHVEIPGQVAVIGLDDDPRYCETGRPSLTSLMPDFEHSGFLAGQLVWEYLNTPIHKKTHKKFGVKYLMERVSTQDVHGYGRIVSQALATLRKSAFSKTLRISDIAQSLNISQRLLEIYFKKVIGHSIKEELTSRRLEALRIKILNSDAPMSKICMSCGFSTASAACVAFKKKFNVSMRQYRKKYKDSHKMDEHIQ